MDISKFLAKVIGVYFILVSIAMLVNMHQFVTMVDGLINNGALMFVIGFFVLILGLLMVVSHNIWQWNWRMIITIIGWLTLLKGTSILFSPQLIDNVSLHFVQNRSFAYIAAIIDLIIGLVLSYYGFKRYS
jgi:hypothetical protein